MEGAPKQPITPRELQAQLAEERKGDPFLVYHGANGNQVIFSLAGPQTRVTIGRSPEADISLERDEEISRLHAALVVIGGVWAVEDDGLSTNGTFVNGRRLTGRQRLIDRDTLRFGHTEIAFRHPGQAPVATTVSASRLRIFLNYRREDTRGEAGRLYDDLVEHFGEESVFRDIDALHGGQGFDVAIDAAVKSCDVVIALVGKQWLSASDASGRRRIHNPDDFVRLELKAALEGNVAIVPLLVEGAEMPRSDELPSELARFARTHALEISDARWHHDRDRLIRDLERIQQERPIEPELTGVPDLPSQSAPTAGDGLESS